MSKSKGTKKSATPKKRRTSRRKKSGMLSGLGVPAAAQKHVEQVGNVALTLAGIAAGNFIGKQLDKVEMFKGEGIKQYAKPGLLIIAGGIGNAMLKNNYAKSFSTGVAVAGGLSLVNKVTKQNLVDSLGDAGEEVYREDREAVQRMLRENNNQFQPNLPGLERNNMKGTMPFENDFSGSEVEEAEATIV